MVAEVLEDRSGEAVVVGAMASAAAVTSSSNHWVENVYCFADSEITQIKILKSSPKRQIFDLT